VSIQSVSFYQQDLNYWQKQQAEDQATSADNALINVMAQAETNLGKGLASIANGQALTRVKSQLSAAVQAALNPSGSSTSASTNSTTSSSSTSSSASPASTPGAPAIGIGTVPLTRSASLSSLGLLPGGTFSISDGTNITKYTSTGTDTVADLINAINSGPAFVVASINANNKLVITGRNLKEIVTVQGSGNDAGALGFGTNNNSFLPTAPTTAKAASTSSSATASSTSTSASTAKSSSSAAVSTIAEEASSSAASILSASGVSGNLIDMLA
jgi:hypothetical protein